MHAPTHSPGKSRWPASALLGAALLLVSFGAVWSILDWRGSRSLEEVREGWSARGWPTTRAELLPPIAPEDDAAPIYDEAFAALEAWSGGNGSFEALYAALDAVGASWDRPELWNADQERALCTLDAPEFRRALELLHEAACRPDCRFLKDESIAQGRFLPQGLKAQLNRVVMLASLREMKRGNASIALQHLESAVALTVHLSRTPVLLSFFYCVASGFPAFGVLHRYVEASQLDPTHAQSILRWIDRFRPEQDFLHALDGERILFGTRAWSSLREGAQPTSVWLPIDRTGLLYSKLLRPLRLFDEARYWAILDEQRESFCAHPWDELHAPASSVLFPISSMMLSQQDRGGRLLLALRRSRDLAEISLRLVLLHSSTGSYPPALDSLGEVPEEPTSEAAYAYARVGDGFTLGLPGEVQDSSDTPMHWTALH